MKGAWLCALSGRHKWDQDIESINERSLFHRVDCVRCGHSIDGA